MLDLGQTRPTTASTAFAGGFGSLFTLTQSPSSNDATIRLFYLGAKSVRLFRGDPRWRAFYTQQHGDNITYELIPSEAG